jgi:hypothetical protein
MKQDPTTVQGSFRVTNVTCSLHDRSPDGAERHLCEHLRTPQVLPGNRWDEICQAGEGAVQNLRSDGRVRECDGSMAQRARG